MNLLRLHELATAFGDGLHPDLVRLFEERARIETNPQVVRLAATNFVLCGFRLGDVPSMGTMVQDSKDHALQQAHLSILLAARQNEQAAA